MTMIKRVLAMPFFIFCLSLITVFGLMGCAANPKKSQAFDESHLKSGLATLYFFDFYNHIDEMPGGRAAFIQGKPGKPILVIDHDFGDGPVFDSDRSRGVGIQMMGRLHFERAGQYALRARSNDGIRVIVDDQTLINDPDKHAARLSPPGTIDIDQPGWYPVLIRYFQRKGTAALGLHWKTPGTDAFVPIPAAAYAHTGDELEK